VTVKLEVRRAVGADVDSIARIHVAGYEHTYRGMIPDEVIDVRTVDLRRRSWHERLTEQRARDIVVVGEVDGEVSGFMSGGPAGPRECGDNEGAGCLENLYVLPPLIGTGVASQLAGAMHSELISGLDALGFTEAVAFVMEDNTRGLRFLQSRGWELDGSSREVEGVVQNRIHLSVSSCAPPTSDG